MSIQNSNTSLAIATQTQLPLPVTTSHCLAKDVLETLKTYTHLFQDQKEDDFEKIRQLF
ncbi:TPA: hypothetical protein ACGO1F_000601 [Streptococcus suis]